MSVLNHSPTI